MDRDLKDAEKSPVTRLDLLTAGAEALEQSLHFVTSRYTRQSDRQAWTRITANLIVAIGGVLKDADLDDLLRRIEALEEVKK